MTHGHVEEANKILHDIADYNGKPIPSAFKLIPHHHESGKGVLGLLELFKTPNLRKKTLIVYYMWFATACVYYGLTLNSNAKGSLFTYYCLGKGVLILSKVVSFSYKVTSRRCSTSVPFAPPSPTPLNQDN